MAPVNLPLLLVVEVEGVEDEAILDDETRGKYLIAAVSTSITLSESNAVNVLLDPMDGEGGGEVDRISLSSCSRDSPVCV